MLASITVFFHTRWTSSIRLPILLVQINLINGISEEKRVGPGCLDNMLGCRLLEYARTGNVRNWFTQRKLRLTVVSLPTELGQTKFVENQWKSIEHQLRHTNSKTHTQPQHQLSKEQKPKT